MPTYYDILNVAPGSEDIVIRAAYRALMAKYHPDKFKHDPAQAERMARLINEAYAVLSDPRRRAEYDATLRRNASAGATGSAANAAGKGRAGDAGRASHRSSSPPPPRSPHSERDRPVDAIYRTSSHGFRHAWLVLALPLVVYVMAEPTAKAPGDIAAEEPPIVATATRPNPRPLETTTKASLLDIIHELVEGGKKFDLDGFHWLAEKREREQAEARRVITGGEDVPVGQVFEERPDTLEAIDEIERADTAKAPYVPVAQPAAINRADQPKNVSEREQGPRTTRPNLSSLSADDVDTIEITCAGKRGEGIVAYNGCLRAQAGIAMVNPHPDLSPLVDEDIGTIEITCAGKRGEGVAAYNSCLRQQLRSLAQ